MNKRLPLALLLSLLFVYWYLSMYAPQPAPGSGAADSAPPVAVTGPAAGGAVPGTSDAGGALPSAGAVPSAGAGAAAAPEPETPSVPVAFSGEGYVAQFETGGAALASLDLTGYHAEPDDATPLRLVGRQEDGAANFMLRDLEIGGYPLDTVRWTPAESATPEGRQRLSFTWTAPDGLRFTRTITDTGAPFTFGLELTVTNTGAVDPGGTITLVQQGPHGLVNDGLQNMFDEGPTALAVVSTGADREVHKWSGKDLASGAPRRIAPNETLLAAGSMSNYFAALLVPDAGSFVSQVEPQAVLDPVHLQAAVDKQQPRSADEERAWREQLRGQSLHNAAANLVLASRAPAPGESVRFGFTVYAGPKDRLLAESRNYGFLIPVLDDSYGRMAWINHALLAILRFFEWLTGNWGFAIILLTVLVRVLLFPLNRVQQASMAKYSATMQRLKPELDALKARYKGNTRKFNEEQMKLLRSQGASPPLGGCLLMFLQFPIWISLFQILRTSIELRQAPWIGWVTDLARPDNLPFPILGSIHLLPILMAVATMLQMRLQPKPADESQAQMQKIMGLFMPVVMLFFLYSYPSGLSLYIFTSSLLSIVEYQIIRRYWPAPGVPQPATASVGSPAKVKS